MGANENKEFVRHVFGSLGAEGAPPIVEYFTEDIEWKFFGSHRFAGVHLGKDDIEQNVLLPILSVIEKSRFTVHNLIAEGDQVVVEGKGIAMTKDGREYNNNYCVVVTVRDGKISSMHEHLDSELVTSIFGKK